MIKKYLSTILVICMIASTVLSGCNGNIALPAEGTGNVSATEKKVSVYRDSLTSDETVVLHMVGDVPYIKIDDYYNALIFSGAEKYPQQASLMKVTRNGSVYETTAYDGTKGVFDAD